MKYKEFKQKYPDKKERRNMFFTWLKTRIHELWWNFKNSHFVNHISFLWHWKNFFFCLKYPFWKSRNVWNDKFSGYGYTWYDDIPAGWRIAFGKQLSDDILKAGKETRKRLHKHISWKKMISFQQIKEKWGELCLYASASEEIEKVLDYYEHLSQGYCICCGKPARYLTTGWVEFMCEDCFEKHLKSHSLTDEEIEKEKEECRLNKKDIPEITKYKHKTIKTCSCSEEKDYNRLLNKYKKDCEKNNNYFVYDEGYDTETNMYRFELKESLSEVYTLKQLYNIDLEELWGLKE